MDAERGGLKERDLGGAVGGLAPVLGLVVRHVGQNGDFGRHRFVRRPYDRVYLQRNGVLIYFFSGWKASPQSASGGCILISLIKRRLIWASKRAS